MSGENRIGLKHSWVKAPPMPDVKPPRAENELPEEIKTLLRNGPIPVSRTADHGSPVFNYVYETPREFAQRVVMEYHRYVQRTLCL